ncbi:MAG: alpha/beta fold hydrolase [Burkholderiales bacterium]|nr:alpha/beta fold hydrolase [Burkholderiales bacterium]
MIVYLHGFNSTPQSKKARELHAYMTARGLGADFVCPQLPHWPDDAIAAAERAIAAAAGRPVTLVGSSLGGFYATWLAERHDLRAVLLNPACMAARDLHPLVGTQRNLYSGEEYELTEAHIEAWERLRVPRITPSRYLLIVETGDEVLDYREAVALYEGARQIVVEGGDHTLVSFPRHLPTILEFAGYPPG